MIFDNDTQRAFLIELYNITQGDQSVTTTMQTVGTAIGLDKAQAGKTGEELIGKGYVEIKSLSGGISITAEGVYMAQQEGAGPAAGANGLTLSAGPVMNDNDRKGVEMVLRKAKNGIGDLLSGYVELEQAVLDIKAIEIHLLSAKPKTAVIKELLRSLGQALENTSGALAELQFLLD